MVIFSFILHEAPVKANLCTKQLNTETVDAYPLFIIKANNLYSLKNEITTAQTYSYYVLCYKRW